MLTNNSNSTSHPNSNIFTSKPNQLTTEQWKKFLVGLIDGDGSIQVNHWRSQILQYRIVIKLAHKPGNFEMLTEIKTLFGGSLTYYPRESKKFVIWAVNDKKLIQSVFVPIFTEYPFLTTRVTMQFKFMKHFLVNPNIEEYFNTRDNKFENRPLRTFSVLPDYWDEWLAGFIEAEGCFSLRKEGNYSFDIGQLNDGFLIEAIRDYFKAHHNKVSFRKDKLYVISLGSLASMTNVVQFCYPLLQGYKYYQLQDFLIRLNKTELLNLIKKV